MMKKLYDRTGYAITDLVITITCVIVITVSVFQIYKITKEKIAITDTITTIKRANDNIRTYFAYDGNYSGIKKMKGTDFYYRGFLSKRWSCDNSRKCKSNNGVTVKLSNESETNGKLLFGWTFSNLSPSFCAELLTSGIKGLTSVTINGASSEATGNTLTNFVINNCNKKNNSVKMVFF